MPALLLQSTVVLLLTPSSTLSPSYCVLAVGGRAQRIVGHGDVGHRRQRARAGGRYRVPSVTGNAQSLFRREYSRVRRSCDHVFNRARAVVIADRRDRGQGEAVCAGVDGVGGDSAQGAAARVAVVDGGGPANPAQRLRGRVREAAAVPRRVRHAPEGRRAVRRRLRRCVGRRQCMPARTSRWQQPPFPPLMTTGIPTATVNVANLSRPLVPAPRDVCVCAGGRAPPRVSRRCVQAWRRRGSHFWRMRRCVVRVVHCCVASATFCGVVRCGAVR